MGKPAHGFEVRHIEVGPGQVEMRLVRFLHDHGHGLQGLLRAGARDGIVLASRRSATATSSDSRATRR
jgi:hypothetical protein